MKPHPDWLTRNNTTWHAWYHVPGKGTGEAVVLHDTTIAIRYLHGPCAGQIELNSGGWETVTTKQRMNECLDEWSGYRFGITSIKKQWYVVDRHNHWDKTQFNNHMLLPAPLSNANVPDNLESFPFTTEE